MTFRFRFFRPLAHGLPLAIGLPLAGCIQEIPSPSVGECAEYPTNAYDYGDIGPGACLAAPVDLQVYTGEDGRSVLTVVNSNAHEIFSSGSMLSIDLESLEAQLDVAREQQRPFEDMDPVPVVLQMSELSASGAISSLNLPNLSGRVAFGDVPSPDGGSTIPVAFLSNRLSITTDQYGIDRLFAVDMSSPLELKPFDVVDGSEPVESNEITVGKDPFGVIFAETTKGRYLYAVNSSSHTVSVVDAGQYPIRQVEQTQVGLVTDPVFHDQGAPSFVEMTNLAIAKLTYSDSWSLEFVDGTYRAWYLGRGTVEGGAIGLAESGNARTFKTYESSPFLLPGDANATPRAWDADGIGPVSVLLDVQTGRYLMYYEGIGTVQGKAAPRIGVARTALESDGSTSQAATASKEDLGITGQSDDDFILDVGTAGAFDQNGVSDPWATAQPTRFYLWYTGTDSDSLRHLGSAGSTDGFRWTKNGALEFFQDSTFEIEASRADIGDEQLGATGFWDQTMGRFRLWYVQRRDEGSCLAYAESLDGVRFTVGSLEGDGVGCLDLGDTDAYVLSPSVIADGHVLRLWYVSAPSEDVDEETWTLHHSRGFDGVRWFPMDEERSVSLGDGEAWEGGLPEPTILKLTPGNRFRLIGDVYKLVPDTFTANEYGLTLNSSFGFTSLHGHVLGVGTRGSTTSDQGDYGSQLVGCQSWDNRNVFEPAFDAEAGELYYTGEDSAGVDSLGVATRFGEGQYRWRNASAPVLTERAVSGCIPDTSAAPASIGGSEIVRYGGRTWLYFTHAENNALSREYQTAEIRVISRDDDDEDWDLAAAVTAVTPDETEGLVASPTVIPPATAGGRWHMWFSIGGGVSRRIGYASSTDGITWTRQAADEEGNAVYALETGVGGSWDDAAVEAPSVIRDDEGRYHMWYAGSNGSIWRIGYAMGEIPENGDESTIVWTRHTDGNETAPVLSNEAGWWDADGVTHPEVFEQDGRFVMFYEGRLFGNRRVGMAESRDGIHWFKVYEPLDVGDIGPDNTVATDLLRFSTRSTAAGSGYSEPANVPGGEINLEIPVPAFATTGIGASEIAISPDRSFAVVGSRAIGSTETPSNALYVLDIKDDSSGEVFDGNFNAVEALLPIQTTASYEGVRSLRFNPGGSRVYATTTQPDSVLVFDMDMVQDSIVSRAIYNTILGAIPLEPGLAANGYREDQGSRTDADVGPIGLEMSADGRYLWVANGNGNSVYTIDLTVGVVGEVVKVARDIGEEPVALALSPDERYLFVANYVGDLEYASNELHIPHPTIAVIDADRTSESFGRVVARIKNLELE